MACRQSNSVKPSQTGEEGHYNSREKASAFAKATARQPEVLTFVRLTRVFATIPTPGENRAGSRPIKPNQTCGLGLPREERETTKSLKDWDAALTIALRGKDLRHVPRGAIVTKVLPKYCFSNSGERIKCCL